VYSLIVVSRKVFKDAYDYTLYYCIKGWILGLEMYFNIYMLFYMFYIFDITEMNSKKPKYYMFLLTLYSFHWLKKTIS